MRFIAVIILLIAVITVTFSNALLISSYAINKNYVAKNLCENRDNKGMHCNGKCFLHKQLKKQESSDNSSGTNTKERSEVQLYFPPASDVSVTIIISAKSFRACEKSFSAQSYVSHFFKPPCFS